MAKATRLKIMRRFGKNQEGEIVNRSTDKPQMQLANVGDCAVCGNPLLVSIGQHIRFHKACRSEGRKRFGRATKKVIEVGRDGLVK